MNTKTNRETKNTKEQSIIIWNTLTLFFENCSQLNRDTDRVNKNKDSKKSYSYTMSWKIYIVNAIHRINNNTARWIYRNSWFHSLLIPLYLLPTKEKKNVFFAILFHNNNEADFPCSRHIISIDANFRMEFFSKISFDFKSELYILLIKKEHGLASWV